MDDVEAQFQQALDLLKQGDVPAAAARFRDVALQDPTHAGALYHVGVLSLQSQQPQVALGALEEAARLQSENPAICFTLALVYHQVGRLEEGIEQCRAAMNAHPRPQDVRILLARLLQDAQRHQEARRVCAEALNADPNRVDALVLLASLHMHDHELDEALACYRRACSAQPDSVEAAAGVAAVLERLDRASEAYDAIEPLLEQGERALTLALAFGRVSREVGKTSEAIEALSAALERGGGHPRQRTQAHYLLAKLCDAEGRYDEAFQAAAVANESGFSQESAERILEPSRHIKPCITKRLFETMPRSSNRSRAPVFIVGMPRSGTTLAAQIIGAHPQAQSAGELNVMHDLACSLGERTPGGRTYPYCLDEVTTEILDSVAEEYLRRAKEMAPSAQRIVDKLPMNFLHVGLIHALFPEAHLVFCRRNPLDICVSCFLQDFGVHLPYTRSLQTIAEAQKLCDGLMQHWKQELGIPIHTVDYEQVVMDLDSGARALLDHCGLPWDDRCLQFHLSPTQVDTLSYDQVRRPIYTASANRHKNYQRHLQPYIDAIGAARFESI